VGVDSFTLIIEVTHLYSKFLAVVIVRNSFFKMINSLILTTTGRRFDFTQFKSHSSLVVDFTETLKLKDETSHQNMT